MQPQIPNQNVPPNTQMQNPNNIPPQQPYQNPYYQPYYNPYPKPEPKVPWYKKWVVWATTLMIIFALATAGGLIEVATLEGEVAALQEENQRLSQSTGVADSSLSDELETLKAENETLSSENKSLKTQIENLEKDSSKDTTSDQETSNQQETTNQATTQATNTYYSIGETITGHGGSLTIDSVETLNVNGTDVLVLWVTVKNDSDEELSFTGGNFRLISTSGKEESPDYTLGISEYLSNDDHFQTARLFEGGTDSGWIEFETELDPNHEYIVNGYVSIYRIGQWKFKI